MWAHPIINCRMGTYVAGVLPVMGKVADSYKLAGAKCNVLYENLSCII